MQCREFSFCTQLQKSHLIYLGTADLATFGFQKGMATTANAPNPLQIPVVDISGPDSEESIADQLVHAATLHGFVYIKNLGRDISIEDIDHAFDLVGLVHFYELYVFC